MTLCLDSLLTPAPALTPHPRRPGPGDAALALGVAPRQGPGAPHAAPRPRAPPHARRSAGGERGLPRQPAQQVAAAACRRSYLCGPPPPSRRPPPPCLFCPAAPLAVLRGARPAPGPGGGAAGGDARAQQGGARGHGERRPPAPGAGPGLHERIARRSSKNSTPSCCRGNHPLPPPATPCHPAPRRQVVAASRLGREEFPGLHAIFNHLDADRSGGLDAEELRVALQRQGKSVTEVGGTNWRRGRARAPRLCPAHGVCLRLMELAVSCCRRRWHT